MNFKIVETFLNYKNSPIEKKSAPQRSEDQSDFFSTGEFSVFRNLSVFLFMFFISFNVFAEVNVRATVDRNLLAVGDTFTLQVSVSSDQSVSVDEPGLPVIRNVQLLHQWASSQSSSSVVSTGQGIDFKTIRAQIFNYQFSVTDKGVIVIDPITVNVAGKSYVTNEIKIDVSGTANYNAQPSPKKSNRTFKQPSEPQWPADPVDELEERFNQLLNRQFGGLPTAGGYQTEPRNSNEAFFILAEVDKTEAFKGEQIVGSWYLYTRGRVRDIDTLKYPSLKGFWKEDIQISTQLNFEQDVVNGIPYTRALLASYALFPIEAGKAKIDSYKAKATIMGGLFSGKGYQATKSSEEIPILIKPLPENGKPDDFTGAVGEFQMMVDAPNKSVVSHQPFPIKIRYEGHGNAKLIELPKLPIGDDLEIYDIKNESQFFKNGQSYKEFEVLLIPRHSGEIIIGELTTSYFNPKTGAYSTLISKPIRLSVLEGVKQESMGEERLKSDSKKKVLPPIATQWNPNFKPATSKLYIWIFVGILCFLILMTKLIIDLGLFNKKPSLEEIVNNRFSKIDKLLDKNQLRALGIEVANAVYFVLGQISGEGGSNEELDKVLAKIAPSVRREIEIPLRKHMDFFGILGFGPKSFVESYKDTKELKAKIKDLKNLLLTANQLNKGNLNSEKT
jgi:hypothetical protein